MSKDGFLEFKGGDILSAADDDVFLAINNEQVAFFVERGHVSGVEPATAQRFGGSVWLAPVTLHNAITPRDDFADGLPIARHVVIVSVHYANLHAGKRIPGHGLTHIALLAIPPHP